MRHLSLSYSRAQTFDQDSKKKNGYILIELQPFAALQTSNIRRLLPLDVVLIFDNSNFANSSNKLNISSIFDTVKKNILSLFVGQGFHHSADRVAIVSSDYTLQPLQPLANIRPSILNQQLTKLSSNEVGVLNSSVYSSALSLLDQAPQIFYKNSKKYQNNKSNIWEKERDKSRLILLISEETLGKK
jgi:hypothetical protein